MLNRIIIHGRLTADPELKQTQSGVSVCNFTVAVDRSYKNGEEKQTDFFTAVCWRGLADMVSKYFAKGKEILISGEMQSRKWQDNEGNNRISWEIKADSVDFCGNKTEASAKAQTNEKIIEKVISDASNSNMADFEEILSNDGVPF